MAIYDIWEVEELVEFPWRVQLYGYVGQFASRERAECYLETVKKERARQTTGYMEAAELPSRKKVK
jgi:hypothetical protein